MSHTCVVSMRPTSAPIAISSPSLTLNVISCPFCSANTVVSVASNVPVASNSFSFPPQATIIRATLANIVIFFILR